MNRVVVMVKMMFQQLRTDTITRRLCTIAFETSKSRMRIIDCGEGMGKTIVASVWIGTLHV
ncbi:hypothetical protein AK812_SmicGene46743, partial [Symbiodinium microadriaticum]